MLADDNATDTDCNMRNSVWAGFNRVFKGQATVARNQRMMKRRVPGYLQNTAHRATFNHDGDLPLT